MVNLWSCLSLASPHGLAWLPLATMAGVVLLGLANARQRHFCGKEFFLYCHVAMFLWLASTTIELLVPSGQCRIAANGLSWLGSASLPLAWALFIYHFAFSIDSRPRSPFRIVLLVWPLLVSVLAISNPWHGQFYTSISLVKGADSGLAPEITYGPIRNLVVGINYALVAATFGVLLLGFRKAAPQFRLYFTSLAVLMSFVIVPNLAFVLFKFNFNGFDPTPFSFVLVVALCSVMVISHRVFDVSSVAPDLIFANLRSPVLVVDKKGLVLANNPMALSVFPELCEPGRSIANLAGLSNTLSRVDGGLRLVPGRRITIGERFYDLDAVPVPAPLSWNDLSVGTVFVFNDVTAEELRYRDLEAELATNMRQLESQALLQAALREAAEFDPLTRVRNRLSLPGLFVHCIDQAAMEQRRVVVALFDIDHFKQWNDHNGHAAGDRVLRDFARFLEVMTKRGETVFRIGGEEFLLLFPDATVEAVAARVSAMQESLAGEAFQRADDGTQVTFSAGVAQWPEDGTTLDALLETADRRLYAAKSAGRNCVIAA